MRERIHKRLPVKFVEEVLGSFNQHRIPEKEAMALLGLQRSRLHQLRKRWLLRNRRRPFSLWRRRENTFHLLCAEVQQWLEEELRYIRQRADVFRGKFNFAFLAEEAEKKFGRSFNRNSFRLYALKLGYYHARPEEKGKVYTRFETSGPGALFQHDSSFHLWLPATRKRHYLLLTKDDYSRLVVTARLVAAETSWEHLLAVQEAVLRYGRPLAYYVDNHSIFRYVVHQSPHVRYRLKEDEGEIQFRRVLNSLDIGLVYTGKRQAQAKGKVEKAFDYFQRRLPYLCEKHNIRDLGEAQKILDDLVHYYNEKRIHEETKEIPAQRWREAMARNQDKLRPLEPSLDLEKIFAIHLQRKSRKDGTIMFMSKKFRVGCPEGTILTICLVPQQKFMVYRGEQKIWEFHL